MCFISLSVSRLKANAETQTRKVQWCQKRIQQRCMWKVFFYPAIELLIKINILLACCDCNPQTCLSNDFPSEKAMLLICWEKNWVCTVCTSVNVYYSSMKNSHPCLFSCGDVIWIHCIKDRPCVLIETIKSNVAPRKVFLFQMYFVTSALDQTIITVGDKRVFLHITKLIYVNIHLWGTRTWCAPMTLLYHVDVLDQKQSRVTASCLKMKVKLFFDHKQNVVFEPA